MKEYLLVPLFISIVAMLAYHRGYGDGKAFQEEEIKQHISALVDDGWIDTGYAYEDFPFPPPSPNDDDYGLPVNIKDANGDSYIDWKVVNGTWWVKKFPGMPST